MCVVHLQMLAHVDVCSVCSAPTYACTSVWRPEAQNKSLPLSLLPPFCVSLTASDLIDLARLAGQWALGIPRVCPVCPGLGVTDCVFHVYLSIPGCRGICTQGFMPVQQALYLLSRLSSSCHNISVCVCMWCDMCVCNVCAYVSMWCVHWCDVCLCVSMWCDVYVMWCIYACEHKMLVYVWVYGVSVWCVCLCVVYAHVCMCPKEDIKGLVLVSLLHSFKIVFHGLWTWRLKHEAGEIAHSFSVYFIQEEAEFWLGI